jgi:maltose alpha-D-glucosyltransferase/alpha-amylase
MPDSLWYKDAILYELRVSAFQDSNADGIGDFRGLIQRLDYLKDLGVTAIWLLPFYPSPMRDDGYDISDYVSVHPDLGTLDDFKAFLRAAHKRDLRVITELVLNHTSDQHPWFQRARRSPPGSRFRNFYVWSDTPQKYAQARIIFRDFERSNWTWDPVAQAYYWHRFYSHQPDLNYESPDVRRAVLRTVDFWLRLGVDGMRLDAVPYLYEREGTICENLPETHAFLRELRAHIDARFPDRMLLAEANQWPVDAVAYFGQGDECHMAFHFPVMPRLFMAIHMEDRFPVIDILRQTPPIPETCQWALFLRNHDELTLEMVTDEERDYMYRVYAYEAQARINLGIRRRLAPLLGKDRRRIELMNALLFSLPGTPIIYYGDEIGMGDNIYLGDRNGVRTPMQWSADRNAGFSRANPQRLQLPVIVDPEYHYESVNVEAQQANPHSLLWWMKRIIALRKRYRAFGRGSIRFLQAENRKVLSFVREYQGEQLLVVANLSRFVQHVELPLQEFRGFELVELFARTRFPSIEDRPYALTLGPHSFYWFSLERRGAPPLELQLARTVPEWELRGSWQQVFRPPQRQEIERALVPFLIEQPWFPHPEVRVLRCQIEDEIELRDAGETFVLMLVRVERGTGEKELFLLPVSFVPDDRDPQRPEARKMIAVLKIEERGGWRRGWLVDAGSQEHFGAAALETFVRKRSLKTEQGAAAWSLTQISRSIVCELREAVPVARQLEEPPSFVGAGKIHLKVYRRLVRGLHPEAEIGSVLAPQAQRLPIAPFLGAWEYRPFAGEPTTLAVAHAFVPHESDLWQYTTDHLRQYFERVLSIGQHPRHEVPGPRLLPLSLQAPPPEVRDAVGAYFETASLVGTRLATLHRALASASDTPEFSPEPITLLYQRSLYQSLRNRMAQAGFALADQLSRLQSEERAAAERLLGESERLLALAERAINEPLQGMRIRCHGNLHLGRVLHTGSDLVVVGFGGDPSRSPLEARVKRPPFYDVASVAHSFRFAVERMLVGPAATIRSEDVAFLRPWSRLWERWIAAAFVRSYLEAMEGSGLLPQDLTALDCLLAFCLIERNLIALAEEVSERLDHVSIPLGALLEWLDAPLC